MATVLLVEDDPGITDMLRMELEDVGHTVVAAADKATARRAWHRTRPDLILLDLNLPDGSGLDLCRELRATSTTPIIILTARRSEIDRVVGLELGADDYVVKPFSPRELIARIHAILRRREWDAGGGPEADTLQLGPLKVEPERHRVAVAGRPVHLTRTEFRLLEVLCRHPGRVYSRAKLIELVWDGAYIQDRVVDSVVSRLRRKLGEHREGRPFIRTVHGVGYALDPGTTE